MYRSSLEQLTRFLTKTEHMATKDMVIKVASIGITGVGCLSLHKYLNNIIETDYKDKQGRVQKEQNDEQLRVQKEQNDEQLRVQKKQNDEQSRVIKERNDEQLRVQKESELIRLDSKQTNYDMDEKHHTNMNKSKWFRNW